MSSDLNAGLRPLGQHPRPALAPRGKARSRSAKAAAVWVEPGIADDTAALGGHSGVLGTCTRTRRRLGSPYLSPPNPSLPIAVLIRQSATCVSVVNRLGTPAH